MNKIITYQSTNPEIKKAVVAFLVEGDRVLLGHRKRVSNGLGQDLISGIGGKLEENETNEEALIREIKEEIEVEVVGYREMGRIKFYFPHKPAWNQDVIIYIVDKWEGEPNETTDIKPEWFDKNEIPADKMWKDNSYWLGHVLSGKKVNAEFIHDESGNIDDYILENI